MPKQSTAAKPDQPSQPREQTKVVRRRRRRPPQSRNRTENRGRTNQRNDSPPHLDGGHSVAAWTRAPRPAEPPPRNPNVFSYTYTTWKTS